MPVAQNPAPFALAALLLSVSAPSVFALTAEEVWAEAQRLAAEADVTLTAITRRQGDRLVLTGVVIPFGPLTERVDLKLERIDLQERPDGTVAVLLPPAFPVTFDLRASDPDFDFITLAASAPGFSLVIAGLGEEAALDLSAPSLVLSLAEVVPALDVTEQLDVNLAIADLSLQHKMDLASPTKTVVSSLRLGTLHGDAFVAVDDVADTVSFAVDLSNVEGNLDAFVPQSADSARLEGTIDDDNPLAAMLQVLGDGLSLSANLSHGPFVLLAESTTPGEQVRAEISALSGAAKAGVGAEGLFYELSLGKTEMATTGDLPELDYPKMSIGIGGLAYGVSVGIGDLVSPQKARVWARLTDLTIPPEIWAEADPSGTLGLEPLSYGLDASATYAVGPEMLEPGWRPDPNAFPPLDIVDLTLNELMFRGAGITLDGKGSLAFDETDLTTFEGLPAPEGKLAFTATGVNALLDRLVAAGLVPPDELTAFRMGLMVIAKAGKTPDSLVSDIEFREKSLFLNGMKIR
jgi:Uncharacterized protein conserved in bacteria (DUF2125)